jgi:hypothetical protein
MSKIRELIDFQKIKEVVDIDALGDKRMMVENYVITKSMEEYLVHIMEDLQNDTHKAAQIIGGYGSGKSHLLGFIISILTDKDLRDYIQNEKVKEAAQNIDRNFILIHWELQPNDVALSDYFYDRIELQLKDKYDIDYSFPGVGLDHKKNIMELIAFLKKDDPSRELVVVVDEISDFLKQKEKEKITRDVQFLRIIGQTAQENDFMFIGAMQEHIFSNPKYVDEAESFGRVSERFQIVTIHREDIKKVISKRILKKTREQRIQLEELFSEYTKHYPQIMSNIEEYIDLFPLHPYVIEIFSELPYFEKRGIIKFTMEEVERILDKEFPEIIAYDLIYDEIAAKHTVKNLEMVSPVVDAIQTLDSKIDLLPERDQDLARKIVKALGVLKLYGKSLNNGATPKELANTLLILPEKMGIEADDEISLVVGRLRKFTDGQFINKNDENYYYLDLALTVDYDQVIVRKSDNLSENAPDDELLSILKDQLRLENEVEPKVFEDTCNWKSRKSFREGQFIYEDGKHDFVKESGDYQVVFVSPLCPKNRYAANENRLVISGSFNNETIDELKMVAAAKALINDNYQRSIIQKKYVSLKKDFAKKFVSSYLQTGTVEIGSTKKSIASLISREFSNFDEMFTEIKPELFDSYFSSKYSKHPKFSQSITRDNIIGEFNSAAINLVTSQTTLFGTSKSVLNALDLLDTSSNFSTENSEVAQQIRQLARDNAGKSVSVDDIISSFEDAPYGYDYRMTQFVILALTYNGEIALKAAGGKTITSSEVADVFKSGIEAFENIRYLVLESEFDVQPVISLFIAVGLKVDVANKLRVSSKRNDAIKEFRTRYLKLREDLDYVEGKLKVLSLQSPDIVDIDGLKDKQDQLSIPLDDFEYVKTPNDLKKIIYEKEDIENIKNSVELLEKLHRFYEKYFNQIEPEVEYAIKVKDVLSTHSDIIDLGDAVHHMDASFEILGDSDKLISSEDFNPLLGKLQMLKKKYQAAYYSAHEQYVGDKVDWSVLSNLTANQVYSKLLILKNIQLLDRNKFIRTEAEISSLSDLHCPEFRVELLDKYVLCPRCSFPSGTVISDIDSRIEKISFTIEDIYEDWENTILSELESYKDNLQYLTTSEKAIVEDIIRNSELPDTISNDLVVALNNLFRELESIELDPKTMINTIFDESQVMDYSTFEKKLNEFKDKLVAGKDLGKVRIKLAQQED